MNNDADERLVRLELAIGHVLRAGVILSSVCLAAGLGVQAVNPALGTVLLRLGIIVLIVTPASRVVLSLVSYLTSRDWLFVTLTAVVLAELGLSVIAALVFHARL